MSTRQSSAAVANNHRMDPAQQGADCDSVANHRTIDDRVEVVRCLFHRLRALSRYTRRLAGSA